MGKSVATLISSLHLLLKESLQHFDAVGWVAGRANGCKK